MTGHQVRLEAETKICPHGWTAGGRAGSTKPVTDSWMMSMSTATTWDQYYKTDFAIKQMTARFLCMI